MSSVERQPADRTDFEQHVAPGPCVLVVEDDDDSQYIYRVFLDHHGFRVVSAGTSHEAIRLAREVQPDVILMDVSIPGMDGWSTTRALKEEPRTASVPIIVITAHAFPQDEQRAGESGCDGFLSKPCELSRIKQEILRVLHDSEAEGRDA